VTSELLDVLVIEPSLPKLGTLKTRDRTHVIDVELIAQINERKKERQQREHAFVPVLHVEKIVDLLRLERERLAALCHYAAKLRDRKRGAIARLDGFAQGRQQRIESAAPNACFQ
jgi:hypothetical protein